VSKYIVKARGLLPRAQVPTEAEIIVTGIDETHAKLVGLRHLSQSFPSTNWNPPHHARVLSTAEVRRLKREGALT
jgi:hypothetical protein